METNRESWGRVILVLIIMVVVVIGSVAVRGF